jgi:hypothetical protein
VPNADSNPFFHILPIDGGYWAVVSLTQLCNQLFFKHCFLWGNQTQLQMAQWCHWHHCAMHIGVIDTGVVLTRPAAWPEPLMSMGWPFFWSTVQKRVMCWKDWFFQTFLMINKRNKSTWILYQKYNKRKIKLVVLINHWNTPFWISKLFFIYVFTQ